MNVELTMDEIRQICEAMKEEFNFLSLVPYKAADHPLWERLAALLEKQE